MDPGRRALSERISDIIDSKAQGVFNATLYPWQREVILQMALMTVPGTGVDCAPLLLVRPTGGGKSMVRYVFSVLNAGVSLTITPLLSLGADQEEKVNSKSTSTFGAIAAIHMDEIRARHKQKSIIKDILAQLSMSNTTTFLFSSPQAIVKEGSLWMGLLESLIKKNRLSMVCVDKVHLFVYFGLTFRKEFKQLKTLYNKLKLCNKKESTDPNIPAAICKTKVPILFMTATCSKFVVERVQVMTRLDIDIPSNVYWPGASEMAHRHVFLEVAYTIRPLHTFQTKVGPLLQASHYEKYIYYSNTRSAINSHVVKLGKWIDKNALFKADIMSVVGSQMREQKFYHVRVFLRSNIPNGDKLALCTEAERPFNPQILAATSGAANAGLDDPEVFGVTRIDFPPSCLDIKQEKGRAGRRPDATSDSNWYLLCFSLESLVVLLKRMWDTASKDTVFLIQAQKEIDQGLALFVLADTCLQSALEVVMANPYIKNDDVPPKCVDSCSHCTGLYTNLFPTLVKSGVWSVLLQVFLGEDSIAKATLDKELVDAIRKFKGSNRVLFGTKSDKKPEAGTVKKMILVLMAAKIMKYNTKREIAADNKSIVHVYGALAFDADDSSKLALNVDKYWAKVKTKES
jgi:superfamily II DNA helicase RecQ